MLPKLLSFEGQQMRLVINNGEAEFVAKDVCSILALDDVSKAVSRLDEDEKGTNSIPTPGGNQEMICVNEYGLYSLILGSRKPEAKDFKRWITHEVIPSIRKTGSYSTKPTLPQITKNIKARMELLLLSGISKQQAYSRALASEELASGVDLSEFKPTPTLTGNHSLDITLILEAIRAAMENGGVYKQMTDGSYALNRDTVYKEFDSRGLSRKSSLSVLNKEGILVKGRSSHFTKRVRIFKSRIVRAVFVRVEGVMDQGEKVTCH